MEELSPVHKALVLTITVGSLLVWLRMVVQRIRRETWVEYEPRTDVPWTGLDVLLLAMTWLVLDVGTINAVAMWLDVDLTDEAADPRAKSALLVAVAVSRVVWLILAISFLRRRSGAQWSDLGVNVGRLPGDLRLGCMTFLAAFAPVFSVQMLLTRWFKSEHPLVQYLREHMDPWRFGLATVLALVIAPLAEELLFRVVIQGWLEARIPDWQNTHRFRLPLPAAALAVVLSAILFALLHFEHGPDPVALFVLALFLGYVYRRTHRLAPSLTAHMCVNGLSLLQLWLILGTPHRA